MGMSEEKPWPDSIRAGECEQHEPLVRRVLAPNPSPYTFTGTQTWIVGAGRDVAGIDPGPTGTGASLRSEEHPSELPYLKRNPYAVFFLQQKKKRTHN